MDFKSHLLNKREFSRLSQFLFLLPTGFLSLSLSIYIYMYIYLKLIEKFSVSLTLTWAHVTFKHFLLQL